MTLEQLTGRYFRLKQELSIAYKARPWQSASVDRLADDIARTEREISALQSGLLARHLESAGPPMGGTFQH